MKVTTVHNTLAGVVQMYTELLEDQARENQELRQGMLTLRMENDRLVAMIEAKKKLDEERTMEKAQ